MDIFLWEEHSDLEARHPYSGINWLSQTGHDGQHSLLVAIYASPDKTNIAVLAQTLLTSVAIPKLFCNPKSVIDIIESFTGHDHQLDLVHAVVD